MSGPRLLVDVGNTSTTTALMTEERIPERKRFLRARGVDANIQEAAEIYGSASVSELLICSVVPDLTGAWGKELASTLGCECWELTPGCPLPIPVTYPDPGSIGADRLANAVAATEREGAPVVVADFGTALTFDIVTREEGYVGGVICPGIEMMYQYFGEKTALLPRLRPSPCAEVIGKSTAGAMHAGAYFGYRGMVREIFSEIRDALNLPELKLVATGGFAEELLRDFDEPVYMEPDLTLLGLALTRDHASTLLQGRPE